MNNYQVAIVEWSRHGGQMAEIRNQVFIHEQKVPVEIEHDPMDSQYIHALAIDEEGNPIGTGRLMYSGKIGRMAVLESWRGKGVGRTLLHALMEAARGYGMNEVELDAQIHAAGFYSSEGFVSHGAEFMDAGIPHIRMKRCL